MMEFLLLASAHFLALLSPGPDFFLLMQASLRLPLRYCFAVCAGISAANGVYLLLTVLGFEVLRESGWVHLILKYAGASYLMFIGIMLLRAPRQSLHQKTSDSFLHIEKMGQQFFIGFTSAILNPKNVIFYLSLFTVMVSVETGLFTRCFYALWMMSVVFVWDCCLVTAIGRNQVKTWLGNSLYYIEKVSGVALACFGIFLPFI